MSDHETHLLSTSRFDVVQVPADPANPNGKQRQVIRHPGAVAILPLVDDTHLCLIRNYRVSVGKELLELPAGTLEPEEPHAVTAERELIEETGYRPSKLELVHSFYLSPGILDEQMHLYVATGLTQGEAAREEGELITNYVVSWKTALQLVKECKICDAKSIAGILMYDQLKRSGEL
ncbi:MAG: NUDIX hydrolase [Planctomycetaceae bacterium]|nr:NUDIX hydrolase [Planctomycetaceae bacterium]